MGSRRGRGCVRAVQFVRACGVPGTVRGSHAVRSPARGQRFVGRVLGRLTPIARCDAPTCDKRATSGKTIFVFMVPAPVSTTEPSQILSALSPHLAALSSQLLRFDCARGRARSGERWPRRAGDCLGTLRTDGVSFQLKEGQDRIELERS